MMSEKEELESMNDQLSVYIVSILQGYQDILQSVADNLLNSGGKYPESLTRYGEDFSEQKMSEK